jgi:hypothetical protein
MAVAVAKGDVDLVPVAMLAQARKHAASDPFYSLSPLPPSATAFYGSLNCWGLAIALHEATGLPIEVNFDGGLPVHAYAVDGDNVLDAFGRRGLRFARAHGDGVQRVSVAELVKMLRSLSRRHKFAETGLPIEQVLGRREWRLKAARAAELLIEAAV